MHMMLSPGGGPVGFPLIVLSVVRHFGVDWLIDSQQYLIQNGVFLQKQATSQQCLCHREANISIFHSLAWDVNQVTMKLCLLYRAVSFLSFAAFFMHLYTVSIFWESRWRTTRLPVWWNYNMRARSIQMRLCTFTYIYVHDLYMINT